VAVHDPFGAKKLVATPENLFAFYEQGLVDLVSTDFAAGEWDSMLQAIDESVSRGLVSLPKAVSTGTKNVADAIPGIAPNLGLLARGYGADIVVTEYPHLTKVDKVYIGGRLFVDGGARVA
jgi:imidazolonepropionase-like amidohydrolase